MPTYERCHNAIEIMARDILERFESHHPILDANVKIDFIFAYPDYDEDTGEPANDALKKNGLRVLGLTRKLSPKDRAAGRGDAEIMLDGDWWKKAARDEQEALLDHELHHLAVKTNRKGEALTDDLGHPLLRLRKHDHEFGWFTIIAQRHRLASQEVQQARRLKETGGQFYWPELFGDVQEKTIPLQIATA